ncbi:hypothetical protein CORC01_02461 [Colletotrichum orchidophilum]|uniref:Uncharacterized protein n=1 Tax=Colletotrichum orchidophilum TaxID=1209926 RepID=A0A1G4BL60_9PEZI|nr:uncharacterized protein CORC01_02461 [Colletotrichum orchidophilum]OHF02181.1 hypothetical protein CORC01_02461 [Colletotrichum orchidophilum]
MDGLELPDIDGLLVTADNPARADLPGLDHERCASLHNYLVYYAWVAEGRPAAALDGNTATFFTTHGDAAEALRPRLDPSLADFLDTAMLPPADAHDPAPFFFWAAGIAEPDGLFDNETFDLFDEPEDALVCLYPAIDGQGGGSGGGLWYHQPSHRAAVFMSQVEYEFVLPVNEGQHAALWHPLETVLSNWITLIRLGKVKVTPQDTPSQFGSEKIGGRWEWRPYGDAQVADCIAAWDRLCDAIEARTSGSTGAAIDQQQSEPLLPPAVLDAASILDGFARAFLTGARRPRFRHVAPGLALPSADAAEFTSTQPFAQQRGSQDIPPVCLLPAAQNGLEADMTGSLNPFHGKFGPGNSALSRVPAGVYSESVSRDAYGNAEEGFRLLLPFGLHGYVGDEEEGGAGARKSDGSFVEAGSVAELFQHGYKPFGGDQNRPQRLERLLDHWLRLVDEGVWRVGPQGVEGSIETFREADTTHWRHYHIPPSW